MPNNRAIWAVASFLTGGVAGSGLGYLILLLTNVFLHLFARPAIGITWGQILPLGILMGLALAASVLHAPLGD